MKTIQFMCDGDSRTQATQEETDFMKAITIQDVVYLSAYVQLQNN